MKKFTALLISFALLLALSACGCRNQGSLSDIINDLGIHMIIASEYGQAGTLCSTLEAITDSHVFLYTGGTAAWPLRCTGSASDPVQSHTPHPPDVLPAYRTPRNRK